MVTHPDGTKIPFFEFYSMPEDIPFRIKELKKEDFDEYGPWKRFRLENRDIGFLYKMCGKIYENKEGNLSILYIQFYKPISFTNRELSLPEIREVEEKAKDLLKKGLVLVSKVTPNTPVGAVLHEPLPYMMDELEYELEKLKKESEV